VRRARVLPVSLALLIALCSSCLDRSDIGRIHVFVKDPAGSPVKRAEVVLDQACCKSLYRNDKPRTSCTELTNELGKAELKAGEGATCSVTITTAGFQVQTKSFPVERDDVRVEVILLR
jgi:hypothetical protein